MTVDEETEIIQEISFNPVQLCHIPVQFLYIPDQFQYIPGQFILIIFINFTLIPLWDVSFIYTYYIWWGFGLFFFFLNTILINFS